MEWIRISHNKLKIMLSAEDARRYALRCESADYADVVTRQAFRDILTDVRRETGFDATEDKVYIQMYPSKEGGCELFVTRVGLAACEEGERGTKGPHREPRVKKQDTYKKRSTAFSFSCLNDLLSACRRLKQRGFTGESEVWQGEDKNFLLLLFESADPLAAREDLRFLREYGTMKNADAVRLYLCEHGKPLCEKKAIETLSALA